MVFCYLIFGSRFELARKLVCTSNERRMLRRRSAKPMSAEHVAKRNNLVNPTIKKPPFRVVFLWFEIGGQRTGDLDRGTRIKTTTALVVFTASGVVLLNF